MRKLNYLISLILLMGFINGYAQKKDDPISLEKMERGIKTQQHAEMGPIHQSPIQNNVNQVQSKDQWDVLFTFSASGPSHPGVETDGTNFYTTTWNAGDFTRYDMDGSNPTTFTVAGVSNLRDMAYDGQYFYGSDASMTLQVMDLANEVSVNTISCSCTGVTGIRHIAYDPGLDGGNGGFWIGNWDELGAIDMNGNELIANIAGVTSSAYGSAYDNWTDPSNPKLWLNMQGAGGDECTLHEFDINSQSLTGVSHSAGDVPGIGPDLMAGGACSYVDMTTGKFVLVGNNQQDPNLVFGYELALTADPTAPGEATNFTATAGSMGALEIQVDWDNPAVTVDGSTLTDLDSVVLYVDDVSMYVNNSPTIGGTESQLVTVADGGMKNVKIVGYNDAGEGLPVETSLWVGPDAPPAVLNLAISNPSGDIAQLDWTNPSSTYPGVHGGYFDGTITGYTITRHPDDQTFNVTGMVNTWQDNSITSPQVYSYTIVPENSVGAGAPNTSSELLIGMQTVTLPFTEDFEAGNNYFFLEENVESTVSLSTDQGVGGSQALLFTGNTATGWPVGTTTADEAWTYTDHHAFATINVDASALNTGDGLMLTLDLKQEYSYQETYNWFRLLADGTPIATLEGDSNINPGITGGDFVTLMYNLSDYAGSVFTLKVQSACKYDDDLNIVDNVSIYEPSPNDLKADYFYGNMTPTVNEETMYHVVLTNMGSTAAADYTVELFEEGTATPVADTSVVGNNIDPLTSDTIDIAWTPTTDGATNIRAAVTLAGDGNNTNDTTAYKQVVVQASGTTVVSIGNFTDLQDGSPRIPFDFYWKNSLSETIYYNSEINAGGLITGLKYKYNFATDFPSGTPIKIWIGETAQNDLSGGYIPASDLTQVFDGTVVITSGGDYMLDVTFDDPFMYSGANNLVILANRPMDTDFWSSSDRFFTTVTSAHPDRSIGNNSDSETYDPYSPPAPEASFDEHPDVQLFMLTTGLGSLNGIVDDGSNPVANVEISVLGDTTAFEMTTTTDASGEYMFPYLPADNYDVVASKFGYQVQTITDVAVTEDDTTTQNITLSPLPTYTVSGFVEGSEAPGTGLEGATVTLQGVDTFQVVTDVDGNFAINDVWDGYSYAMEVTLDGYQSYEDTVTVSGANVDVGTITLTEVMVAPYDLSIDQEMVLGSAKLHWNWNANPSNEETYILDDGTSENGWAINPGYTSWLGNLFEVTDQGEIVSFNIYGQANASAGSETVTIEIFDASQNLVGASDPFEIPADDWTTVAVPDVPFNGNFYAMIKWDMLTGQTNYAGFDENGPNATADLDWYYDGSAWSLLHVAAGSSPGVFLLQATANVTGKGVVTYTANGNEVPSFNYDMNERVSNEVYNKPTPPAPKNTKAFESFNVYLDDLTTPVANTTDTFYLFDALTPGAEYTAGVSSVYTGGETDVITLDFTARPGSSENDFLTYSVPNEFQPADINTTDHTVDIFVPVDGIDSTNIVPTFTIPDSATITIDGVPQVSGETVVDFSGDGMVTYTITAENGDAQDWVVTLMTDESVNELFTFDVEIYPVPANDLINVVADKQIKSIRIMNVAGEVSYYKEVEAKDVKIDVENFESGIYMIQIQTDNNILTRKLQIVK